MEKECTFEDLQKTGFADHFCTGNTILFSHVFVNFHWISLLIHLTFYSNYISVFIRKKKLKFQIHVILIGKTKYFFFIEYELSYQQTMNLNK